MNSNSCYAVIFSSILQDNHKGYHQMAEKMVELAKKQNGYLGHENAREEIGITISYWKDLESIKSWKENLQHLAAQEKDKKDWYKFYKVRICKVEKEYEFYQN